MHGEELIIYFLGQDPVQWQRQLHAHDNGKGARQNEEEKGGADVEDADIIIVGMKKTGRSFRKLFGSTVTTLAEIATIPLIVVPEEARYTNPVTIVLANEADLEESADKHVLDALIEIGEKFYSRLYMVRVAKNKHHEAF